LTLEDLATRWQVNRDRAVEIVRDRGVPWFSLRTTGTRGGPGPQVMRFRLPAVEAWERSQEGTSVQIPPESNGDDDAAAVALGWDGVDRL
jgi:hypothetical protein